MPSWLDNVPQQLWTNTGASWDMDSGTLVGGQMVNNPLWDRLSSLAEMPNLQYKGGNVYTPEGTPINGAGNLRGPNGENYYGFSAGTDPFQFNFSSEGQLRSGGNQGQGTYFNVNPRGLWTNPSGETFIVTDPSYSGYTTYEPMKDSGMTDSFKTFGKEFVLPAALMAMGSMAMGGEGASTLGGWEEGMLGSGASDSLASFAYPGAVNNGIDFAVSSGAPVVELGKAFTGFNGGSMWQEGTDLLRAVLSGGSGGARAPWSPIADLFSVASGVKGLMDANELKKRAALAANRSDPFGPYRTQYAEQLSALMANPSSISSMPGYRAGLDAVQRSVASQCYLGSGNMMAALAKYGGDFFNNTTNQLSNLAGANFNPATAAGLEYSGNRDAASIAMQALNRLGYGAVRRFG